MRRPALFLVPENLPDFKGNGTRDASEPALETRRAASYVMKRGLGVELIDVNVTGQTSDQVAAEVAAMNPQLVSINVRGFNPTASTQTMVTARLLARAVRNFSPRTPIIFSGTHPAALPERTLGEEPTDFVCTGEGPVTIYQLLQALEAGGDSTELQKVESLCYRQNDGAVFTQPALPIDLNTELIIPAAWQMRDMDPRKHLSHHWHANYGNIEARQPYANPAAREGCPFHCTFCPIQVKERDGATAQGLKQGVNTFRTRKVELFVDELQFLHEGFGVRLVKIPDEMFWLGNYQLEVAKSIIRRGLAGCFKIWCYGRIDSVKPNQADLEIMRQAGFDWVALGIESANSTVRDGADKSFKDSLIFQTVEALRQAGFKLALNYMFGFKNETPEMMQATLRLGARLNSEYWNGYCVMAYPGSLDHQLALAHGYPLPERAGGPGWAAYAQYGYHTEPYCDSPWQSNREVLQFRDDAHRYYYLRPEYLAMLLRDPDCGEKAVVNVRQWMEAISPDNLRRRLLGHPA